MTRGTRDGLPATRSAGTGFGTGPKKATQDPYPPRVDPMTRAGYPYPCHCLVVSLSKALK